MAMLKLFISARHAVRGIVLVFRKERNTRLEFFIGIIAILTGWWLQISLTEWCLVLFCFAGILAAESFNTSIELLCDYHTREIDPKIRDIKDIAAGAVMFMALLSLIVGILIFAPKIWLRTF